ncbi:transposase, partial [Streptomyces collinus]|uniref:transposase n=1 Tax=Streptomyces collinus TaxID=42684 RepID=UPI003688E4DF
MDNRPAHKGADIRRWARKNKVELCFTPTYASWANPIDCINVKIRDGQVANRPIYMALAVTAEGHRD